MNKINKIFLGIILSAFLLTFTSCDEDKKKSVVKQNAITESKNTEVSQQTQNSENPNNFLENSAENSVILENQNSENKVGFEQSMSFSAGKSSSFSNDFVTDLPEPPILNSIMYEKYKAKPINIDLIKVEGSTVVGSKKYEQLPYETRNEPYNFNFGEGKTFTIPDFYIGKTEVTVEEYMAVMGSDAGDGNHKQNSAISATRPAIMIFCNRLSMAHGLTPCYVINGSTDPADWGQIPYYDHDNYDWDDVKCDFTANGYRMPVELEWEYAARGGKAMDTYIYSGADKYSDIFPFKDVYSYELLTAKPNRLGIYDMSRAEEVVWSNYNISSNTKGDIFSYEPFDWSQSLKLMGPKVTERRCDIKLGGRYFRVCRSNLSEGNSKPNKYVGKPCTVSYLTAKGTAPKTFTVNSGYKLLNRDLPFLPKSGEYYFAGWSLEKGTKITSDVVLKAAWEKSNGLIGTKPRPDKVYDIVFSDGSAIPYTSNLVLTPLQKTQAIAVIFKEETIEHPGEGYFIGLALDALYDAPYVRSNMGIGYLEYAGNMLNTTASLWAEICRLDPERTSKYADRYYPGFDWINNYAKRRCLTGDLAYGWRPLSNIEDPQEGQKDNAGGLLDYICTNKEFQKAYKLVGRDDIFEQYLLSVKVDFRGDSGFRHNTAPLDHVFGGYVGNINGIIVASRIFGKTPKFTISYFSEAGRTVASKKVCEGYVLTQADLPQSPKGYHWNYPAGEQIFADTIIVELKESYQSASKVFCKVQGPDGLGGTDTIQGSPESAFLQGRSITLSDYEIAKVPVTKEMYARIMGDYTKNKYHVACSYDVLYKNRDKGGLSSHDGSWYDCLYFCNLLSLSDGLEPVYTLEDIKLGAGEWGHDGDKYHREMQNHYQYGLRHRIVSAKVTADFSKNGYRLPTEAEWEYVMRGADPNSNDWNLFKDNVSIKDYVIDESYTAIKNRKPVKSGLYLNSFETFYDDFSGELKNTGAVLDPISIGDLNTDKVTRDFNTFTNKLKREPYFAQGREDNNASIRLCRTVGPRKTATATGKLKISYVLDAATDPNAPKVTLPATKNVELGYKLKESDLPKIKVPGYSFYWSCGFDRVINNSEKITLYWVKDGSYIGTQPKPSNVGDIVFADGSAVPYSDSLKLTKKQDALAIAIIYTRYQNSIMGMALSDSGRSLRLPMFYEGDYEESDYAPRLNKNIYDYRMQDNKYDPLYFEYWEFYWQYRYNYYEFSRGWLAPSRMDITELQNNHEIIQKAYNKISLRDNPIDFDHGYCSGISKFGYNFTAFPINGVDYGVWEAAPGNRSFAVYDFNQATDFKPQISIAWGDTDRPKKYIAPGYKLTAEDLAPAPAWGIYMFNKWVYGPEGKEVEAKVGDAVYNGLYLRMDIIEKSGKYFGTKAPSEKKVVGDIVFTDGSATPAIVVDNTLTDFYIYKDAKGRKYDFNEDLREWFRDEKRIENTVGIVFYDGVTSGSRLGKKTLMVGKKQFEDCLISDKATLYLKDINMFTKDDMDGSDNFEVMKKFIKDNKLEDDTAIPERYPAFYNTINYKDILTCIKGTKYESGWYIPVIEEWKEIHKLRFVLQGYENNNWEIDNIREKSYNVPIYLKQFLDRGYDTCYRVEEGDSYMDKFNHNFDAEIGISSVTGVDRTSYVLPIIKID